QLSLWGRRRMPQTKNDVSPNDRIPILDMSDTISLIPMVGVIDSTRSQLLMESALDAIQKKSKLVVIVDILGISTVDSAVAAHLIKLSNATRLMGCETIISGISPEIAQTMVNLGVSLKDVQTNNSLKNAILAAYRIVGLRLTAVDNG
ncbi:MAG: STAS domain-containing protein, partial [Spirochaetales bacterium]|nr:STAS domain-containing protein [Spirochaetales bacterium]